MRRAIGLGTAIFLIVAAASGAPEGALAGRVFDADGQPVAGARVIASPWRTDDERLLDGTSDASKHPVAEAKTARDGSFRISAKSEVSLRIDSTGAPSVELPGPYDAGDAEVPLEIDLPAVVRLHGRVVDATGKPIAGAAVRVDQPLAALEDGAVLDEAKTDSAGAFSLLAPPDGTVTLRVRADGYPARVVLIENRREQRVVLIRGGSIVGIVTAPSGVPAAGAIVTTGESAVRTGEDGRFELGAVAPGTADVRASAAGALDARRDGVAVRVGKASRVDLRLAPSAAIAGVVLDGASRKPIGRARVAVRRGLIEDSGARPVSTARADAQGRFRAAGLAPRGYTVIVSHTGWVDATAEARAAIPAGTPLHIAMIRDSAVTGTVVDEDGRPVAGASVRLDASVGLRSAFFRNPAREAAAARTDARGAFRIAKIPPGLVVSVVATRDGFLPARKDGIRPGTPAGGKVRIVLGRGLAAEGSVVDRAGKPVSGAEVELSRTVTRRLGGGGYSSEAPEWHRTAETDAAGRFRLGALDAGTFEARVSHAGFATLAIPAVTVSRESPTRWSPFVLSPAATLAGHVVDSKGAPIAGAAVTYVSGSVDSETTADGSGRFRIDGAVDGAKGTLYVDADGFGSATRSIEAPAEDVAIVLAASGALRGRVEDGDSHDAVPSFTASWSVVRGSGRGSGSFRADDGAFELTGVGPGKIQLTVAAASYLDARIAGIDVAEGETKDGIVVTLRKGQRIAGRVLDEKGDGVANATVSWRRPSAHSGDSFMVGPGGAVLMMDHAATTDADGRFEYDAVPAEKLVFKATHPDYLEAELAVDAATVSAVDITVPGGAVISGTVVGSDGVSPAAAAHVSLQKDGAEPYVLSGDDTLCDASGAFSFPHLKEGRYLLSASGPGGGRSGKTDVVIAPGQSEQSVVLHLGAGAVLRGTVSGLPAERRSGLFIDAYSQGFSGSTQTDAQGQFSIPDVLPGVLRVSAATAKYGPSMRSISKNVEVPEAATEVSVDLEFAGSSHLTIRVTRHDGPVPGVQLALRPSPEGSPGAQLGGETNADGTAVIEDVADGAYAVSGFGYGMPNFTRAVDVSGETSLDVALGGAAISGVVSDDASGEPLAEASVVAETGQETSASEFHRARTDSRGTYAIDGLDTATYRVTARTDGYKQKTASVDVADASVDLPFRLEKGGGLSVVAFDGLTGLPLSALQAVVFADSGAVAYSGAVALDASGGGDVGSLAAGTYAVCFSAAGYANRCVDRAAVPSTPLSLGFTPGGRLVVRAASPAAARLFDAEGGLYLTSLWILDGHLSIAPPATAWENLAPGPYRLTIESPDGRKDYPFTVIEGQTATVEVP